MPHHMQCAWVYSTTKAPWAGGWLARQRADKLCRVDLLECLIGTDSDSESFVLPVEQLIAVRSRVLCVELALLAVGSRNLAWMRTALAACGGWPVPVIVVVDGLRGEAIDDLMRLGLHDFIDATAGGDELRLRCTIAARRRAMFLASANGLNTQASAAIKAQEPACAYPEITTQRSSGARLPSELFLKRTFGCTSSDPFGMAKARVVAGFERAYLHAALQRHQGNIARAARACDKHRRAFWGLVRKHGLDVDAYRQGPALTPPPPPIWEPAHRR